MRTTLTILVLLMVAASVAAGPQPQEDPPMKYNDLTPEEERVLVHKGTERPFSGDYEHHWEGGTYLCKRCNASSRFFSWLRKRCALIIITPSAVMR